jgi:hypothetical protein
METTITADQYRKSAARSVEMAEESFQRCDTDGFMSQWSSGINARLDLAKADIVDQEYVDTFVGLYVGQRRIKAKAYRSQFGTSWVMHESEQELISLRGGAFLPTGRNSRIHKKLGIREALETAPAWAKISGEHLTNLSVVRYRTGCKWGTDAVYLKEFDK